MLISIFCVLNVSFNANNPPPVPYIDINDLKRLVIDYDVVSDKDKKNEFIQSSKELIDTIEKKYNQNGKNKVQDIIDAQVRGDMKIIDNVTVDDFLKRLRQRENENYTIAKLDNKMFNLYKLIVDILDTNTRIGKMAKMDNMNIFDIEGTGPYSGGDGKNQIPFLKPDYVYKFKNTPLFSESGHHPKSIYIKNYFYLS